VTAPPPSWTQVLERAAAVSGVAAAELADSFEQVGGVLEDGPSGAVSRERAHGVPFHDKHSPGPEKAPRKAPGRRGGKGSRRHRRARLSKRRKRHEERAARLKRRWFGRDEPDVVVPELKPQARARAERVAFDPDGRMALEALVTVLPWGQAMGLCDGALAGAPFVDAGITSHMQRADLHRAGVERFPHPADVDVDELVGAAAVVSAIAPSWWFRERVAAAVGMWTLARRLTVKERGASRGGVYVVEGFSQGALSWVVPRVEGGKVWSRSPLWRSNGPFLMLGERPRRPGREPGDPGLGLFVRWQPPAHAARFKGPVKTRITKSGQTVTEQHALAVARYDAPMCGRTAWSAAQRGNPHARAFCRALCPWLFDADDGAEAEPVQLREPAPAGPVDVASDAAAAELDGPADSAPERPPDRGPPAGPDG